MLPQEWWELSQLGLPNTVAQYLLFPAGPISWATISTTMPSALTSTLVSAGIIGLCI